MSLAKESYHQRKHGGIYTIGPTNPYVGRRVRVTWLKPWGGKPVGYTAEGELLATFCVRGRTLIGELKVPKANGGWRKISCPWSRRYLQVEVVA